MRRKYFKYLILICALTLIVSSLFLPTAAEDNGETVEKNQYSASDVVKPTLKAYSSLSNYSGLQINTDLVPEDIFDIQITDHGGITTDGQGRLVFSNYATVSISLKTEDMSMNIPGTDAKIVSERSYSYGGSHVGREKKQELDTKIGYGVILTSLANSYGEREISEEIYITNYNDSLDGLRVTKDGDYHIVILMTVKEGIFKKKIAVEYVIPIRTKLYVTDESGEFHVKDEGAYYDPVRLDALERPDIRITVNNQPVPDGYVIKDKGKYNIKVYVNGFLCENFNFEIFSKEDEHAFIYLANARKRLDAVSYECENYFSVRWSSNRETNMTYWKDNDPDTTYTYTSGERITEVGTYVFTLHIPSLAGEEKTFLVNLVDNDDPAVNYNTLYANRFNNFKTKWYEVYDESAELYYCFAMNEYVNAYDAAMTLERAGVVDYGHYYTYKDVKYTDKTLLTEAINENALANIKEVYYDPAAEKIEKYFSDRNFDGTVYLNPDFQFVRTSVAETNKVTLIAPNGESINVAFFTPISTYDLDAGVYTVIEEDKYGNKSEYSCIVDTTSPTLTLKLNGEKTEAYDKMTYTGRYFELCEIIDEFDPYAVTAVEYKNGEKSEITYFYRNECEGTVFFEPGMYYVRIYDRNNNVTKLTFNIVEERQYELSILDGAARLKLKGDNVKATAILANGTLLSDEIDKREWSFEEVTAYVEYLVTTVDTLTGETDYLRFVTEPKETESDLPIKPEDPTTPTLNNDGNKLSYDIAIIIIVATAVVALAACIPVMIKIWRRNDD